MDEEDEKFLQAPDPSEPVMGRFNTYAYRSDGTRYVKSGYSAPIDTTPEQHAAIAASFKRIDEQKKKFDALTEEQKLKFYIRQLTYVLRDIAKSCQISSKDLWKDDFLAITPMEKRLEKLRLDIFGKADSALMFTPSNLTIGRDEEEPNWWDEAARVVNKKE
jgi:hypothetical protein